MIPATGGESRLNRSDRIGQIRERERDTPVKADSGDKAKQLFREALQLRSSEWAAFVAAIGDENIRAGVVSLLAAEGDRGTSSTGGLISAAAQGLAKESLNGRILGHFSDCPGDRAGRDGRGVSRPRREDAYPFPKCSGLPMISEGTGALRDTYMQLTTAKKPSRSRKLERPISELTVHEFRCTAELCCARVGASTK